MIRIDTPVPWSGGVRWAHLFDDAGDVAGLHAFAQGIGLKRCWFQRSRSGFPHYDVKGVMIDRAREAGATFATREEVAACVQAQGQRA